MSVMKPRQTNYLTIRLLSQSQTVVKPKPKSSQSLFFISKPESNCLSYFRHSIEKFSIIFNAQVPSGGKVPTKPGGCNCSHIPWCQYTSVTGLPNLQPSHELPVPGPLEVPVTLKPDS